jgi:hypothetical protein
MWAIRNTYTILMKKERKKERDKLGDPVIDVEDNSNKDHSKIGYEGTNWSQLARHTARSMNY